MEKITKKNACHYIGLACGILAILAFLFSFVFFFPAIYAKHASTVSDSNFIVLCFASMIIISTGKIILVPYHKILRADIIPKVVRRSLVKEILLGLLILIILCSIYFTVVEKISLAMSMRYGILSRLSLRLDLVMSVLALP